MNCHSTEANSQIVQVLLLLMIPPKLSISIADTILKGKTAFESLISSKRLKKIKTRADIFDHVVTVLTQLDLIQSKYISVSGISKTLINRNKDSF